MAQSAARPVKVARTPFAYNALPAANDRIENLCKHGVTQMTVPRTTLILTLIAYAIGAVGSTDAGDRNPNTDWLRDARIGVFMHLLPGDAQMAQLRSIQATAKSVTTAP